MREVRQRRTPQNLSVRLGVSSLAAQQELAKQGLGTAPERPGGEPPELPEELTELRDRELMALFSKLNRWSAHLAYQLSAAQVDERYAGLRVEKLTALAQIRNKGGSVAAMKSSAWSDEDLVAAKEAEQEAYAYRKLVEALHSAVDGKSFVVSRELTRRIGRNDRDRRQEKYGDRGDR
jgi:hypothetical protein